jgi:hypothetical protein
MTHHHSAATILTLLALTSGCRDRGPLGVCTDELRVHFAPADTSILVGQGFTAAVQLATCGGAVRLSDAFLWQSENTAVATVDAQSGQVVARSPGDTRITAKGERYGSVGGMFISVVVSPPCAEPAPLLGHFNPQVGGYIVMYRAGTDGQQETDRLAAKYQFTPRFVFTHGTQGFSGLLAPDVLASVRCEPSVSFTEYNAAVTVVGS